MKILNIFLLNGEKDFQTDHSTVTFRDWGIECFAQELHEGSTIGIHRKLYIPWMNIKFLEQTEA
jgi:hypothetical protein